MPSHDRLLHGGTIVTLDPDRPRADWLLVRDGRIAAIGDGSPPRQAARADSIDLEGGVAYPGLIDAHAHVLGQVDAWLGVDCSPAHVRSIADLQAAIADRAARLPPGAWIRANDYNEFYLAERRHPTRHELDAVAGARPVRLQHISRHICVLNSPALAAAGIGPDTPDPPGGRIERDPATGEPTGVLYELNVYLSRQVLPPLSDAELTAGFAAVVERYLGHGVTLVHDATVRNTLGQWQLFHWLLAARPGSIRLRMMFGPEALPELALAGLGPRAGDDSLRLGALKILLAGHDGDAPVHPDRLPTVEDLLEPVLAAHRAGHQVAIHAYDEWSVHLAVSAIEAALAALPRADHRHRIEHATVCPDWLVERIRSLGIAVVTQPGFLHQNGERYLAQLDPDQLPDFYRLGSLIAAGIPVAISSDAPVGPVDPRLILHGAITRRAATGEVLAPAEAIPPRIALDCLTARAAWIGRDERDLGSLTPGKLADLAVFDRDLAAIDPTDLPAANCRLTLIGGEVVWSAEGAAARACPRR